MMWLMGLCILYPEYALFIQCYALIDIGSMIMKIFRYIIHATAKRLALVTSLNMCSGALQGRDHKAGENNWIVSFYFSPVSQTAGQVWFMWKSTITLN